MSNDYFRFKQFTVHQGNSAMKVCTDACIQGAWTPLAPAARRVLDIGTGTGLLALMLAQRQGSLSIDAIEIDTGAAADAAQNIAASPWSNRIRLIEGDVITHAFQQHYDLVICNPPFFQDSLLGPNAARNQARHQCALTFDDLIHAMDRLLVTEGSASMLIPVEGWKSWQARLHEHGWYVFHRLLIYPAKHRLAHRMVCLCRRLAHNVNVTDEHCAIREENQQYTPEFKLLLAPWYLAF